MRYIALVSGGKDSIFSIECLRREGHELIGLLYMKNNEEYVDSYMYQTVGSEVVNLFGKCLDTPFYTFKTRCKSINTELEYEEQKDDEIEDLYKALQNILDETCFEGVSSGAILSRYQKNRVDNVCRRLNLTSLAPLWNKNQKELLKSIIDYGLKACLVKVASSSLTKEFLGKDLEYIYSSNVFLDNNYCGEGGEYETCVLDCPLFKYRIEFENFDILSHPEEDFDRSSVFFLKFRNLSLIKKN